MVTFTDAHLAQLNAIVGEIPHKFAIPIIHFVNAVIDDQKRQTQDQKTADEGSRSDAGAGADVGDQNGSGAERGVACAQGAGA